MSSSSRLEAKLWGLNLRSDTVPVTAGVKMSPVGVVMETSVLVACIVASLLLLAWVLASCRSGFEITDEGFYLNLISTPWEYRTVVTQFGFIYHPLYWLVGGDITLLRQANVLIVFGLAFALCAALFHKMLADCGGFGLMPRISRFVLPFIFAAGSLTFFDLWLPTPSYNSLAFTCIMLAALGALLIEGRWSKRSIAGWLLIGTGGAISYLAKPTSAALLGCTIVIYLFVSGKLWMRGLLLSVLTAVTLLVSVAFSIDGSIAQFADRVLRGAWLFGRLTLQPVGHIFRVDRFNFSFEQQRYFVFILTVTFIAMLLGTRTNLVARSAAMLVALAVAGFSIGVSMGALTLHISPEPFQPMQFWAVLFAVTLLALLSPGRSYRVSSHKGLALAAFFLVLPYVYAFGTGNNYWAQASRAGYFWLLSGLVLSCELANRISAWRSFICLAATSLLVPTSVLWVAMEHPYRQSQSLRFQTTVAELGPQSSRLLLSTEAAAYIGDLRRAALGNGLKVGDPVIDVTGASPGLVYALGARAPGAPWLLAGYPGSNELFRSALEEAGCQAIAASWLIIEPDSPDMLSIDVLSRYGIDVVQDYREVGSVHSANAFPFAKFEKRLLKPLRSAQAAREACERADQIGQ